MSIRIAIKHSDLENAGSLQVTEVDENGKAVKRGVKATVPAAGDWAEYVINDGNGFLVTEIPAPEQQAISASDVGDLNKVL